MRALLFLLFVVILSPVALTMRALGRDRLALRRSDATSYWVSPSGRGRCR